MIDSLLAQTSFWMPEEASTYAKDVDWVFGFVYWISAAFFVLIAGLMFYFVIRYRRRSPGAPAVSNITHNTALEITWTILPTILLVFMFWWGFQAFMEERNPPADTYDINVTAQKWSWSFQYPNGLDTDELHCWVGQPTKLVMRSKDVIHSMFIPAFRAKRDVVPGRYSFIWFEATKPGEYPLFCAEYCGTGHSDMHTVVVVHANRDEYEQWLNTADPIKGLSDEQFTEYQQDPEKFIAKYQDDPEIGKLVAKLQTPAMMGAKIYRKKGCNQCHSIDGIAGTGPTWKGLWKHEVAFADGSRALADENYIRSAIVDPGRQVVAGFQNVMPKMAVSDREIDLLIAYIRSLSEGD